MLIYYQWGQSWTNSIHWKFCPISHIVHKFSSTKIPPKSSSAPVQPHRKWRTYFRWCWPEVYLSSAGDNAVVCSPLPGGTGREKGSGATFPYRARNLIQPSRTSLVQWPETLQSRGLKVLIDFHFDYGESLRTIFTQTAVDVCVKLDNYIICILWAGVRSKGVILCWWFQLAVVKLEPWFARLEEPPAFGGIYHTHPSWRECCMMTSSNVIIFRVTGPLWGESIGDRWIPLTKARTRSFDVFFDLYLKKPLNKQSRRRWFETPLRSLWRHCNGLVYISRTDRERENIVDWESICTVKCAIYCRVLSRRRFYVVDMI